MMAPGPLDALPALLDIVANDERAAELSAAPSKEPMTLKIIRARVRIDFYPSAPAMAVDVRNLLLAARDHFAGRDTALAGHNDFEQFPQLVNFSSLYGIFQQIEHATFRIT